MAKQCFVKPGSAPPVCGVHNVPLEEFQPYHDPIVGSIGDFPYFVCPVSHEVPNDITPISN
jgi:hypothetical protein